MELSVIIPIYNEEANLAALYQRLTGVLGGLHLPGGYELLFVNDGSHDGSLALLRALAAGDGRVRYLDFSRNFGHQIAVTAGLDRAEGAAVVIIDADLQDPPELIAALYQKLGQGYEVVYAKRRSRQGESAAKKLTAKLFYRLLARITRISIPVDTGDFRIISRRVVLALRQMEHGDCAWHARRAAAGHSHSAGKRLAVGTQEHVGRRAGRRGLVEVRLDVIGRRRGRGAEHVLEDPLAALDRRIGTMYYQRLLSSQDKDGVKAEASAVILRDAPPAT